MKLDFYFIHGWGFDQSFWEPVCKEIRESGISRIAETIDLGFFSNKVTNFEFKEIKQKSVFIVHSYGLNWFLKNNIKCNTVINFFGVPCFLRFQQDPRVTKKIMDKMLQNFATNPTTVLKDFYRKCNIKHEVNKKIHVKNCLMSLKQLKNEDLTINFNNLKCKVFSIFSFGDNILKLNKENLDSIKNKNHNISFVKNLEHGFPKNNPELCCKMIKKILMKL